MTNQTTQPSSATILFVDDEPRMLIALKAMFRSRYQVLTANSGARALELLRDNDIDVIVSDQRMPQMTGVEFLRQARQLRARAMRVLLTGYSDLSAVMGAINEGEIFRFVNKPWVNSELREIVQSAVEAAQTEQFDAETPADAPPASVAVASDSDGVAEAVTATRRSAEPEGDAPAASSNRPQTTDRGVDVLVIDDQSDARSSVADMLNGMFAVHQASDLEQALSILQQHPVGIIVTESTIGGEPVTDVLAALRLHKPSLVVIVLTAHADVGHSVELINHGQIFRLLSKPASASVLRGSVNLAARRFGILRQHPEQTVRLAPLPKADLQRADSKGARWLSRIGRLFGRDAPAQLQVGAK